MSESGFESTSSAIRRMARAESDDHALTQFSSTLDEFLEGKAQKVESTSLGSSSLSVNSPYQAAAASRRRRRNQAKKGGRGRKKTVSNAREALTSELDYSLDFLKEPEDFLRSFSSTRGLSKHDSTRLRPISSERSPLRHAGRGRSRPIGGSARLNFSTEAWESPSSSQGKRVTWQGLAQDTKSSMYDVGKCMQTALVPSWPLCLVPLVCSAGIVGPSSGFSQHER